MCSYNGLGSSPVPPGHLVSRDGCIHTNPTDNVRAPASTVVARFAEISGRFEFVRVEFSAEA